MALIEIGYGAFLFGSYVYHRWRSMRDRPKPAREITMPRTEEGTIYPLLYGRCRITAPVIAWTGTPYNAGTVGTTYQIPIFFILGIPFRNGTNGLRQIWMSDLPLGDVPTDIWGIGNPQPQTLADLTGLGTSSPALSYGGYEQPAVVTNRGSLSETDGGIVLGGSVEFLNGNDDQLMVSGATSLTMTAQRMTGDFTDPHGTNDTGTIPVANIPDYRRRLGVFLYAEQIGELGPSITGGFRNGWSFGPTNSVPPVAFEVTSYPEGTGLAGTRTIGQEANPADVIYDLMTDDLKLGIPHVYMDVPSFTAAAVTLLDEEHGYSRAIEDAQEADDHIYEILKQIDAVLYEDPTTLKWKLKLVRPDYDPNEVPHFTPSNCNLLKWELRGHTGIPNKIRVVFKDRQEDYRDNSATADNQANAVGQNGEVNEIVVNMPGICTKALAETVAVRELSAVGRPFATCRIEASRGTASTLCPGDVIAFSWPDLEVSRMLFRVAKPSRGSLKEGSVILDLIQDAFVVRRGVLDEAEVPGVPPHKG